MINAALAGINNNTYDSLNNFFDGLDEQIATCKASNTDKAAVFIASAIARASNTYWNNLLLTPAPPVPGSWTFYLNTNSWSVNYNNLSSWVAASFMGALSGYSQIQATSINRVNIVDGIGNAAGQAGALLGSLGLCSGKIILSWPQGPPCSCS